MPKGAADYLAIGEMYHTIFIDDVPTLKSHEVNLVRRFITLIDAMYECNVKVVIHAASDPANIFQVDLQSVTDEGFAFDQTRSRMEEMRSSLYLTKRWVGAKYDVNGDGILDVEELATRDKDRAARITCLDSI
jgi:predicted ATPase